MAAQPFEQFAALIEAYIFVGAGRFIGGEPKVEPCYRGGGALFRKVPS